MQRFVSKIQGKEEPEGFQIRKRSEEMPTCEIFIQWDGLWFLAVGTGLEPCPEIRPTRKSSGMQRRVHGESAI